MEKGQQQDSFGINMGCSVFIILEKNIQFNVNPKFFYNLNCPTGILYGFYFLWPWWKPYTPWLISGNLFLVAAIAALINIFPQRKHRTMPSHWTIIFSPLRLRLFCFNLHHLRSDIYIRFFSISFSCEHWKHCD